MAKGSGYAKIMKAAKGGGKKGTGKGCGCKGTCGCKC